MTGAASGAGLDRRSLLLAGGAAAASVALPGIARGASPGGGAWQPLLAGNGLGDWTFFQTGVGESDRDHVVSVRDGLVHFFGPSYRGSALPAPGHIASRRHYADFHLRLDYCWGERRLAANPYAKRNSGILYRMADDRGVVWPPAVECQLQESDVGDVILVDARGHAGPSGGGNPAWPAYAGVLPAAYPEPMHGTDGIDRLWFRRDGAFERPGWNRLEVIAIGARAAHIVNGTIVATIFAIERKDRATGAYGPARSGRIALEMEGAEIMIRNIAIRDMRADG